MTIKIFTNKYVGKIKPMHAVNNGPLKARNEQVRGTFDAYKAACFPFARNHDASFLQEYGGEHIVDVDNIFPDFDKDAENPANYDFTLTDGYLKTTVEAGTEIFYRLGSKIEHWPKKYHTLPPKDFKKWAVVCEHIIRHYNEEWANGFRFNIKYWEIWNEPDWAKDDAEDKQTWGGTKAEFFDFYEIASKHLKKCFPKLKIGGPASCGIFEWCEDFLTEMKKRNAPLDFFSWHIYTGKPRDMAILAARFRQLLDEKGFTETESILNEWNLIEKGWGKDYVHSLKQIPALRGASFVAAAMASCQYAPVDMLMYYDARPGTCFNGIFDHITYEPLKSYRVFSDFAKMYGGKALACASDDDEIFVVTAENNGKIMMLATLFAEIYTEEARGGTEPRKLELEFDEPVRNVRAFIIDETRDNEEISPENVTLTNNAILFVTAEKGIR